MKAKTTAATMTMMMRNGMTDRLQYVIKEIRGILEGLYICANIFHCGSVVIHTDGDGCFWLEKRLVSSVSFRV